VVFATFAVPFHFASVALCAVPRYAHAGINTQETGIMFDDIPHFPIARTPQAARLVDAALVAADPSPADFLTERDREAILGAVVRAVTILNAGRRIDDVYYRLTYFPAE
jgi:hypothetical protein